MHRLRCLILIAIASCAATAFAAGSTDRPRLAVFAFANETGNSVYDAVCSTAERSLLLTLRQLALYDLEAISRALGNDEEQLRAAAMEQRADYVMFASVSAQRRLLVFSFGLFDRAKGTTTIMVQSDAVSALDLFEAMDDVIAQALDGITGSHIGFGRVELANQGEKGSYRVLLDGIDAGTDVKELSRVLVGSHSLSVIQRRMLEETEIARASFDLEEGSSFSVEFSVPYLTDAERERIEGLEKDIRSRWQAPSALEDIDAKVVEFASLLRDVSYSPRLSEYQDRARQLQAEWDVLKNRFTIEDRAWDPESTLLDPSIVAYLTARTYSDPEAIRRGAESNASLLATLFELAAGKAMSDGEYERGAALVGSVLDFTRYLPEERKTEYAFAAAKLRELVEKKSEDPDRFLKDLEAVFGAQIAAGRKLYDLRDDATIAGKAVVLSSDSSAILGIAGAKGEAGPVVVTTTERVSIAVAKAGQAPTVAELSIPDGRRLAFLDGGFQSFGRTEREVAMSYVDKAGVSWGTISFASLPVGARLSLDGSAVKLTWDGSEATTGRIPPKSYKLSVRVKNLSYKARVDVSAGQDTRVDLPYDYLTKVYGAARKSLKGARAGKALGGLFWLGIGAAGTYLAYDQYQEGIGIYANYKSSTVPATVADYRAQLDSQSLKVVLSGIAGGLGFLLGTTSIASIPSKDSIELSIRQIDEELERLRRLQGVSE